MMIKIMMLMTAVALVASHGVASAEEASTWSVSAKATYIVLGSDGTRMTGGVMPALAAQRNWELGESKTASVGASIGAFGLTGNPRWIGVLTGPTAHLTKHWALPYGWGKIGLGGGVASDFGRIPTCNRWSPALCMRFWGWYPALNLHMTYDTGAHTGIVVSCAARFVRTLAWSGISAEPSVVARWSW